jgi:hypothetical protein
VIVSGMAAKTKTNKPMNNNLHSQTDLRKVVLSDIESIQNDKKSKFQSPDVTKMVKVQITPVTSIYIRHGKSKEEAKQRFLRTHSKSIF